MKLIIDIDEEWYSNIIASKDYVDEDTEAYLILNGVPYEERHGEWVDVVNSEYPSVWHYECSECHERPLCTPFTKEDFLSRFCPNCGANMRGKEE